MEKLRSPEFAHVYQTDKLTCTQFANVFAFYVLSFVFQPNNGLGTMYQLQMLFRQTRRARMRKHASYFLIFQ